MIRYLPALGKVALRNVRVQKRRSAFVVLILTVGCAGLLLVAGFFEGVLLNLREQFIHGATGHLMVARSGYYSQGIAKPLDYLVPRSLGEPWLRNPEVSTLVPRLQFEALLTTDNKATSVGVLGVDPAAESRMASYGAEQASAITILEGRDLDPNDPEGIILGRGVAKILKLKVSDAVTLLASSKTGSIDGRNFYVRGIFQTPIRDFDNQFVKVNLGSAQAVSQSGDFVTSILVVLHRTEATPSIKASLLPSSDRERYEVLDWEERGDFYRNGRDILRQIDLVLQLTFAALIFFSIASSVNMAFFERIREFGTMMALGNPRASIIAMVTIETLLVAGIGVVVGLGVASVGSLAVSELGFAMPPLPGSTSGYDARIVLTTALFPKVAAIGLAAALLASLFVSLRAYSLRIVQALGYV